MSAAKSDMLQQGELNVNWRKIGSYKPDVVNLLGQEHLVISPRAMADLAEAAFADIAHHLRPSHLGQLQQIIADPEASKNDRFVAVDLLKNAVIAAGGVLPMCQDTGTALVWAKRGHLVHTDGLDQDHLSRGVEAAYGKLNLRYSQLSPLNMFDEQNTGTNLPAEIDIQLSEGENYDFLFLAKGGGSANKSFLYQETKQILNSASLLDFIEQKLGEIGTTACPPYHLAIVVGGTSADYALKTAKLAAARAFDNIPKTGSAGGHGYRDMEFESQVLELTRNLGVGAQFGGKYFCHDVRVIRLPRHNGSLPVAIAVSCSADRQVWGRINREGVFLEELETDPAKYLDDDYLLPNPADEPPLRIDLNQPMSAQLQQLDGVKVGTRLLLSGKLTVARDLAHSVVRQKLQAGEPVPQYLIDHPVYYAGPSKTPEGMVSGSFGPTTASRMDGYMPEFQERGAAMITLAKGNRTATVAASCKKYGGFYLGTVGGPAALIAQECIRSVKLIDLPELGMEAVFEIEVQDFPAFVLIDNLGNDFFADGGKKPIQLGKTRLSMSEADPTPL